MENMARYIIRASFSQERMQYLDEEAEVVYKSRDDELVKSPKTVIPAKAGIHK